MQLQRGPLAQRASRVSITGRSLRVWARATTRSSSDVSVRTSPASERNPDPELVTYATFRWPRELGGEDIRVSGSWDAWSSQSPIALATADGQVLRSHRGDAVRTLLVPRGVHDYKFIVDGKWRPAPADPIARDQAGATNNKRLLTSTGLITFKGRQDVEVLVMGEWSDWADAQRMLWNDRTQQWECPLALPPGDYGYLLQHRGSFWLDPDADTTAADVRGQSRTVNRLTVGPACAFTLMYATGWPRCSLVYRVLPQPGAEPGEWRELPFDGAPSRAGPTGGRWMQAVVEAPGPEGVMQFYIKGPRPDINDEWGSTTFRHGQYRGGVTASVDGSEPDGVKEDRPSGNEGGQQYYTLPWPSGWKLERGLVSKFLRALQGPILLCSDVDGTFVSDKPDAWSDTRISDFRTYWEDVAALGGSVLVLNTGRSKGHLMDLLKAKEEIIAVPDVIITAVGTKIWHRRSSHRAFGGCTPDDYEEDLAWTTRLDAAWDLAQVKEVARVVMDKFNGRGAECVKWLDHGTEHPHRIALNVSQEVVGAVCNMLEEEIGRTSAGRWGVKSHIIASGAGEWRYLDVVAERGGKLEAIEWVRGLYGIPPQRCMTAGDSLNDVEMFKGASPGLIVGNAQAELLSWYHNFRDEPPGRIILARKVDASGILEGLARHGLL